MSARELLDSTGAFLSESYELVLADAIDRVLDSASPCFQRHYNYDHQDEEGSRRREGRAISSCGCWQDSVMMPHQDIPGLWGMSHRLTVEDTIKTNAKRFPDLYGKWVYAPVHESLERVAFMRDECDKYYARVTIDELSKWYHESDPPIPRETRVADCSGMAADTFSRWSFSPPHPDVDYSPRGHLDGT